MSLYSEEFLLGLSEDSKVGLYSICSHFVSAMSNNAVNLDSYFETYALIEAYITANEMEFNVPPLPEGRNQIISTISKLVHGIYNDLESYIQSEEEQKMLQTHRGNFAIKVGKAFSYEFSEGDLNRVQNLINELREHITKSELFEEKHRRRLMNRLETLQQELHKKQSDLDHFWGLVGDAGVVVGKFGKNAKPIVDRIKEITEIVWRTQSRAEELPSDSKPALLETDD